MELTNRLVLSEPSRLGQDYADAWTEWETAGDALHWEAAGVPIALMSQLDEALRLHLDL